MLLGRMVHNAALDIEIVELPADNFEEINPKRIEVQEEALVEYRHFIRQLM